MENSENSDFGAGFDQILAGKISVSESPEILKSLGQEEIQKDAKEVQADVEGKPFLEYILNNGEFDREEILELKKKIAQLKSKESKRNMQLLKIKENDLQKIIYKEKVPTPE